MKKKFISFIVLYLLLATTLLAEEQPTNPTLDGVTRCWDNFVSALRQGNMPEAYVLLALESRNAVNYRDFCVEWHPIGIKYNTILSNPNYSNFSIFGNLATVKISLDPALKLDKQDYIRIILEKDGNDWWVVDEKLHEKAIQRASITGVMKDIARESKVLHLAFQTGKGNFEAIEKELPRIFASERGRLALRNYSFKLDLLRNGMLRAIPHTQGELGYQITPDGVLSTFTPGRDDNITAEELANKRTQEKERERQSYKQAEAQRLARINREAELAANSTPTPLPEPQTISKAADLPDLPPDFPQDFTRLKADTTDKADSTTRLNFLSSADEFDLPEAEMLSKTLNRRPEAAPRQNRDTNNAPQTLAAAATEIYTNSVELNNAALLTELELMMEEFHTAELEPSGGTDE